MGGRYTFFIIKSFSNALENNSIQCIFKSDFFPDANSSICFVILFNDGHVLHLRPETVAVRRRMRNGFGWLWWPNGIRGQMWLKFPDIRLIVEGKPRKKPQPDTLDERQWHYPSTTAVVVNNINDIVSRCADRPYITDKNQKQELKRMVGLHHTV